MKLTFLTFLAVIFSVGNTNSGGFRRLQGRRLRGGGGAKGLLFASTRHEKARKVRLPSYNRHPQFDDELLDRGEQFKLQFKTKNSNNIQRKYNQHQPAPAAIHEGDFQHGGEPEMLSIFSYFDLDPEKLEEERKLLEVMKESDLPTFKQATWSAPTTKISETTESKPERPDQDGFDKTDQASTETPHISTSSSTSAITDTPPSDDVQPNEVRPISPPSVQITGNNDNATVLEEGSSEGSTTENATSRSITQGSSGDSPLENAQFEIVSSIERKSRNNNISIFWHDLQRFSQEISKGNRSIPEASGLDQSGQEASGLDQSGQDTSGEQVSIQEDSGQEDSGLDESGQGSSTTQEPLIQDSSREEIFDPTQSGVSPETSGERFNIIEHSGETIFTLASPVTDQSEQSSAQEPPNFNIQSGEGSTVESSGSVVRDYSGQETSGERSSGGQPGEDMKASGSGKEFSGDWSSRIDRDDILNRIIERFNKEGGVVNIEDILKQLQPPLAHVTTPTGRAVDSSGSGFDGVSSGVERSGDGVIDNSSGQIISPDSFDMSAFALKGEMRRHRQGICSQGVEQETFLGCDCNPGFTGKNCQTELFRNMDDYYQTSSGSINPHRDEVCNGGTPSYEKSCVCDVGFTGQHCDSMMLGESGSGLDGNEKKGPTANADVLDADAAEAYNKKLIWKKTTQKVDPYVELVDRANLISNNFVKVSTGLKDSGSSLKIAKDSESSDGHQYKFDFKPNVRGKKSRLELSTCYVMKSDYDKAGRDHTRLRKGLPSMLQHLCKVVTMPIEAVHTYSYQLRIMKRDFPDNGSYIMTQWHGTSDGTILRDDEGCVARVSDDDLVSLCEDGSCAKGQIMSDKDTAVGLRYEQGGYPPLSFHFKDGTFYVIARSDEREFIAKSGCHPGNFDKDNFSCPLYPRQQFHVIWKKKFNDFPFNKWNSFIWKIKWSEYGNDLSKFNGDYDGGVLLSNAWIRLWINSRLEIDWKGPCGRNDNGRVPYFKMGIYNPSGSIAPVLFRTRGFGYSYNVLTRAVDAEELEQVKSLRVYSEEKGNGKERNTNELKYGLKFRNSNPDYSEVACTLKAESSQLATIASVKYSPIKNNKQIRTILRAMADVILEQQERIKELESKHADIKRKKSDPVEEDSEVYDPEVNDEDSST